MLLSALSPELCGSSYIYKLKIAFPGVFHKSSRPLPSFLPPDSPNCLNRCDEQTITRESSTASCTAFSKGKLQEKRLHRYPLKIAVKPLSKANHFCSSAELPEWAQQKTWAFTLCQGLKTRTGPFDRLMTRSATLPSRIFSIPLAPWVAMIIRSIPSSSVESRIESTISPLTTCPVHCG